MANNESQSEKKLKPDQVILTKIQTRRLAELAGVTEKEISNKSVADLSELLKWRVDPRIFFFKRICGKVVKKDPVTGVEYPVPFATVYVEDTDCSFVLYQPSGFPWNWFFPFRCRKEIIGTTKTDACGNFCVWVPRFDIDWVIRWRRERFCFPIIFRRPFIDDYIPEFEFPPKHGPGDPEPWERLERLPDSVIDTIAGNKTGLKEEISRIKATGKFGQSGAAASNILNKRVFDNEMPPPLPPDFQKALTGQNLVASKGASAAEAIHTSIADKLGLAGVTLEGFDLNRFIGPFYRCVDVFVPQWQVIFDVPDITFRVTQDTNGDGVEENIYSEGFFDVRWDAGNISNVTLVASSRAKESRFCHVPHVPCGDVPVLAFAGFMPLTDANYFNTATGYALRPNRPRPSGVPVFPAQTPFCDVVQLYGCVSVRQAKYYRIKMSTDGGATFSAITGRSWNNFHKVTHAPIPVFADADGWYLVEPGGIPRTSLEYSELLLNWPTPEREKAILKIELGDNARNHITESAPVAITTDNTAPVITLTTLAWKYVGEPDTALRTLAGNCPMIKRGVVPRDVELVFSVFVSGHHLRNAALGTGGCGDNSFFPVADPLNNPSHWHQSALDNSEILYQRYQLNAASQAGSYSFTCGANSRSMNPSGADGGQLLPSPDWFYDPVYKYSIYNRSVAVVNENL